MTDITTLNEAGEIATPNPMQLISQAASNGADPQTMERLFALQERYEANEARKAYTVAMAAFKSQNIIIEKNKAVAHGNKHMFDHATLDHICDVVRPHLTAQGLSWSWGTDTSENGQVRVTCKITHIQGHMETVNLTAPNDTSGSKNAIQALGSTVTYLQRYTLLAALGLATGGQDNDGAGAPEENITPEQAQQLFDGIIEVEADQVKFFAFFKIKDMADLPAGRFKQAMAMIDAKRGAK